jgi:hypothetical protein
VIAPSIFAIERVLRHFVIDIGNEAVQRVNFGYAFVTNETLYCLSTIPILDQPDKTVINEFRINRSLTIH